MGFRLLPDSRREPQFLGPILFILFVNNLKLFLKLIKYIFYADNLQICIYCAPSAIFLAIGAVNQTTELFPAWAITKQLFR